MPAAGLGDRSRLGPVRAVFEPHDPGKPQPKPTFSPAALPLSLALPTLRFVAVTIRHASRC